jgi:hypothetical protein
LLDIAAQEEFFDKGHGLIPLSFHRHASANSIWSCRIIND